MKRLTEGAHQKSDDLTVAKLSEGAHVAHRLGGDPWFKSINQTVMVDNVTTH
jgi:hypothetical protein